MATRNLLLIIALISGIFSFYSCEKGGELIPSTTGGGHPTGLDEIERLDYQHLTEEHLYKLVSVESNDHLGGLIAFELDTEFDNNGSGQVWLTKAGLLRTGAWGTTNTIVGDNASVPGYGLTLINQKDGSNYSYKTEERFYEPEFALSQAVNAQVEPVIVFNSDEHLVGTDLCDLELFVPHIGGKSADFEDAGHIAPTHKWAWGSKFTRTVPVTNSIDYEMPDGQLKTLENDVMGRKSCTAIQFPNGNWYLDFIAFRVVSGTDKFERITVQLDSVVHNGNYELYYNPNSDQSLLIHAWTTIYGTAPISGVPPYSVSSTVFQYATEWPDLTYCSEEWSVVNYPGWPAVPSTIVWDDQGPNW